MANPLVAPALINAGAGLIGGFGSALSAGADAARDEMRLVEQQRLANMQAAMQQAAQQQAQMQQQVGTGTGLMQQMSRLPEQDSIAYAMMHRLGAGPGVQMQARDLFNPNAPMQSFQMAGNPMTGYSRGAGGRDTPGMRSFYDAAMEQLGFRQTGGGWSAQSQPQSWQGVWNDIMKQNMHGFNQHPEWTGADIQGTLDDPYTGSRGYFGAGATRINPEVGTERPGTQRGPGSVFAPANTLPGYTPTGTNPFQPRAPLPYIPPIGLPGGGTSQPIPSLPTQPPRPQMPTFNPNVPGPGMPNPPNIPIGPTPQPPVQPRAPTPLPPTQQPSVPIPQPRPEPSQPTQPPRPGPGWVWDTRSNRWVQKGFDLGLPTKGQG